MNFCLRCKENSTIKAHLIPKVFCKEVKVGKSFAANAYGSDFQDSQSGIWDSEILCKTCDGILGQNENILSNILKRIRETSDNMTSIVPKTLLHGSVECTLRCLAGILYKFALTKKENGGISLGKYFSLCHDIAYNREEIANTFDAVLFRLILNVNDRTVFAYRNPVPAIKDGINIYRLFIGGTLFLIKLDERSFPESIRDFSLQETRKTTYLVAPAQAFEEFHDLINVVQNNPKLNRYLEKK